MFGGGYIRDANLVTYLGGVGGGLYTGGGGSRNNNGILRSSRNVIKSTC